MTNEELTMSNEEAREILSTLNIAIGTDVTPMLLKNQILKATSVAIEVLGQQPCEDCISRRATLKAFAEKCGGECGCCEYNGSGYDTAENCKLIKSMPSVTPIQKVGKWIPCTRTGLPLTEQLRKERAKWYGYKCSKCNDIYKGNALLECNYCPNCGAKMEVDE